jgi:hypothetical protein
MSLSGLIEAMREKLTIRNEELRVEVERLTRALERLGSMEAFVVSRTIGAGDEELMARIEFARKALGGDQGAE